MALDKGPIQLNIEEAQQFVQANYKELLNLPFEQGTCKKCLPIPQSSLCVLVAHESNSIANEMIQNETKYLTHLRSLGFPVVRSYGKPFVVESSEAETKLAFIEDFVANSIFIEAKTPAPLKLLIFSALTGTTFKATEVWFLQKDSIENRIITALSTENLSSIKEAAQNLANHFQLVLNKIAETQTEISDLQGLITQDGRFVIIDPLDVVEVKNNYQIVHSITDTKKQDSVDFVRFLRTTKLWLNEGIKICQHIVSAENAEALTQQLSSTPQLTKAVSIKQPVPLRLQQISGSYPPYAQTNRQNWQDKTPGAKKHNMFCDKKFK